MSPVTTEPHDHHHDHDHEEHSELTDIAARVRALESILIDKGYVEPAALDAIIDTYETKVGPRTLNAFVTTRRRPLPSWTTAGDRASIW
jgi:Nitrile hydratase, alpha chain